MPHIFFKRCSVHLRVISVRQNQLVQLFSQRRDPVSVPGIHLPSKRGSIISGRNPRRAQGTEGRSPSASSHLPTPVAMLTSTFLRNETHRTQGTKLILPISMEELSRAKRLHEFLQTLPQ